MIKHNKNAKILHFDRGIEAHFVTLQSLMMYQEAFFNEYLDLKKMCV